MNSIQNKSDPIPNTINNSTTNSIPNNSSNQKIVINNNNDTQKTTGIFNQNIPTQTPSPIGNSNSKLRRAVDKIKIISSFDSLPIPQNNIDSSERKSKFTQVDEQTSPNSSVNSIDSQISSQCIPKNSHIDPPETLKKRKLTNDLPTKKPKFTPVREQTSPNSTVNSISNQTRPLAQQIPSILLQTPLMNFNSNNQKHPSIYTYNQPQSIQPKPSSLKAPLNLDLNILPSRNQAPVPSKSVKEILGLRYQLLNEDPNIRGICIQKDSLIFQFYSLDDKLDEEQKLALQNNQFVLCYSSQEYQNISNQMVYIIESMAYTPSGIRIMIGNKAGNISPQDIPTECPPLSLIPSPFRKQISQHNDSKFFYRVHSPVPLLNLQNIHEDKKIKGLNISVSENLHKDIFNQMKDYVFFLRPLEFFFNPIKTRIYRKLLEEQSTSKSTYETSRQSFLNTLEIMSGYKIIYKITGQANFTVTLRSKNLFSAFSFYTTLPDEEFEIYQELFYENFGGYQLRPTDFNFLDFKEKIKNFDLSFLEISNEIMLSQLETFLSYWNKVSSRRDLSNKITINFFRANLLYDIPHLSKKEGKPLFEYFQEKYPYLNFVNNC